VQSGIIDFLVKVCSDLPQTFRQNIFSAKFTFHFDREFFVMNSCLFGTLLYELSNRWNYIGTVDNI
jgi:hypothetical protein